MGHSNQTTYITMIRDPVDIFVSAWDYYKLGGSYKMTIGKFKDKNVQVNVMEIQIYEKGILQKNRAGRFATTFFHLKLGF